MSYRSALVLAVVALVGGCAKKTPPTQHVQMDPEIIRIIRERKPETAPTEPAPGGRDLMTDPTADKRSAVPRILLAVQFDASSPPWHCFDAKVDGMELGACSGSRESCNKDRAYYKKEGARVGACREQPRAACHWAENPLAETAGFLCSASFEACQNSRGYFAESPEWRNVGECEARRLVDTRR